MLGSFAFHRLAWLWIGGQDPKKRFGASPGVTVELFSMFQVVQDPLSGSSVGLSTISAVFLDSFDPPHYEHLISKRSPSRS